MKPKESPNTERSSEGRKVQNSKKAVPV